MDDLDYEFVSVKNQRRQMLKAWLTMKSRIQVGNTGEQGDGASSFGTQPQPSMVIPCGKSA